MEGGGTIGGTGGKTSSGFLFDSLFNIPRSGALEREKFVERERVKKKKKNWGEAMGRRNNLDGVWRSIYNILSSRFPR